MGIAYQSSKYMPHLYFHSADKPSKAVTQVKKYDATKHFWMTTK